jgi:hypothetical protein
VLQVADSGGNEHADGRARAPEPAAPAGQFEEDAFGSGTGNGAGRS